MLVSTALGFIKALVFAAILDQVAFGQYSAALLVFLVANYLANAGLSEGLGREVPMLRGQGRVADAVGARNSAVWASLVTASSTGLLCALGLAAYAHGQPDYAPLPWVGLMIAATIPCNLLLTDLAGRELSTEYSLMLLLKNGTSLFLGIIAIDVFGVRGALIGEALSVVLTAGVLVAFYSRDLFDFGRFSLAEACRVAWIGVPFMLSSVVLMLTLTLDRWVVQYAFGLEVFAEYAFAFLLWTSGMLFSNVLSVYLGPRIVARYARTGDLAEVFGYVRKLGLTIGAVFAAGAVPALWLAGVVIDLRYPQYASVKPLLLPVYLATMFWAVNFYGSLFVIRGDGRFALWLSIANGVACGLALAVLFWLGATILWYAVAFCVFRLVYLLSSIATAKYALFSRPRPSQ